MSGKKIMAIFAIMVALALSACVEQGTENQTGEIPEETTEVPPAGSEIPVETPSSDVVQPRRQDTNETPVEEPITPEEPEPAPVGEPIAPPEEPVEDPGTQPAGTEEVPGFEAYLALGAIGLAGAAVALTHRKKKE